MGIICHFSPVSTLNLLFKVTMIWDFSFFILVSSQTFIIPFMGVRKTYSPCNPLQNPITADATKHNIYIF